MREVLRKFFRHPATEIALFILIVASIVGLLLEFTLPNPRHREVAAHTSDAITILFMVELALRFAVAASKRAFFAEYWVDILSVLPAIPALRIFRSLRLLRLVRVLRLFRAGVVLGRRATGFKALMQTHTAEYLIVASLVLILVLFGTIGRLMLHPDLTLRDAFFTALQSLVAGEPVGHQPTTGAEYVVTTVVTVGGLVTFALLTGVTASFMVDRLRLRLQTNEMDISELEGHTIVCGWNRTGPRVVAEILAFPDAKRRPLVVVATIDPMPELVARGLPRELVYHMPEDFTRVDVLERAGVRRAARAVVLADDSAERSDQDRDARTILCALTLERLNPKVYTCVELLNGDNAPHLAVAGIEEVVVPADYAGHLLGSISLQRGMLPVVREILTRGEGNDMHVVGLPPELADKTFRELYAYAKERWDATPLALVRPGAGERRPSVVVNPRLEQALKAGDGVVIVAPPGTGWEAAPEFK